VAGCGAERARGQRTREERSEMGRPRRRDCVSLPPMRGTEGKCWLEGREQPRPRHGHSRRPGRAGPRPVSLGEASSLGGVAQLWTLMAHEERGEMADRNGAAAFRCWRCAKRRRNSPDRGLAGIRFCSSKGEKRAEGGSWMTG